MLWVSPLLPSLFKSWLSLTGDGEIQAYFPATTEDILEGTIEVDVRKYEVAHVKVQWENADKPMWVKIDNLEITHLDT